jgi:hypothetical protein
MLPMGVQGQIGPGNANLFPADAQQGYTISPDAEKPKVHIENIKVIDQEFREKLNVFGVNLIPVTEVPESGIARAYKFQAKNQTLQNQTANNIEFDNSIYDLWNKYNGATPETKTISISYNNNFSPESPLTVEELMVDYQNFLDAKLFIAARETLKEITKKRFSEKVSQETLDNMLGEIETVNLNERIINEF